MARNIGRHARIGIAGEDHEIGWSGCLHAGSSDEIGFMSDVARAAPVLMRATDLAGEKGFEPQNPVP